MRIGTVDIGAKVTEPDKIAAAIKASNLRTNITEEELRSSLGADVNFKKGKEVDKEKIDKIIN